MAKRDIDQLGWLEILGLRETNDAEWSLVRAAQLRELSKTSFLPMVAVVLGSICIIQQFWGTAPATLMGAWLSLLVMNSISVSVNRKKNLARQHGASRADVMKAVTHCAIFGIFWSVPPLFFAAYANPEQLMMLAAFCLVLMGVATLALTAIPLAGIAMIVFTGGSLAIMLLKLEMPVLASLAVSYALCLSYALLVSGRTVIARLRNELTMHEQQDVVSLMLRENTGTGSDWLWQIDARKCIVDPGPRFVSATGIKTDQLDGMPILQLLAGPEWQKGEISDEVRTLFEKIQHGETFSQYHLSVDLDGNKRWWNISGTPRLSRNRHVVGYRGVIADVTDRQAIERRTHQMAHFDGLTGLANRAHTNNLLHERVGKSAESGSICAFLMIDLDRFKAINDTLGHPIGDQLLVQVAKRLASLLEPGDKCGRIGGDEFAMIIARTGYGPELDERAKKIIAELSRPYSVDNHILHIGASIGSAICPRDGRSAPTLLRNADLALYKAKEDGRGIHASFEPALAYKAEERRKIEMALRKALENGEFSLVYQPVITLANREIAGFEALLRWTNPELGDVSPHEFVPIAEETRLLDPIGEWVFRTACAEAANWPENYRLAINLSPGQLRNPRTGAAIVSALSHAGLSPERLEVETTEEVLGEENAQALATFKQLIATGVTIALDDFGSGRSTLGFVGQTQLNSIKIDRSFIRAADDGCKASIAVIRAIVAMANSLGISTIAEGVEDKRQYQLAERLGCTQVQGFFLERPLSASEIQSLVREHRDQAAA